MALVGRLLASAVVVGAVMYHLREMRRLFHGTKSRRPHVFLAVKGDPEERARRRAVVLRNAGEIPARHVTVHVNRDAMIWTNARGEPDPQLAEERVPFSTLDVCRYGAVGIPPGGEHPVAFLTPAGRFVQDRHQKLECTIRYFDGEGARYEESIGMEYLA
jgi:hypothetical protein